ncbi:MAG: hypothetical protein ACREXR_02770 [Gammaproteobacteria bacterium]
MRTTIVLPDDLFRQAKAKAALSGITLKDLIARYVAQGLREGDSASPAQPSQRSPLPVILEATTGKPIAALSKAKLADIELAEDIAKHERSVGR